MRNYVLFLALGCSLGCGSATNSKTPPDSNADKPASLFGRFVGRVVAKWDDDGRNMTLLENFAYVDGNERRWDAPSGSVINGASIPQPFWSVIGGPFEGQFRNASVVHDTACERMDQKWEDVHLMFFQACRCGGVSERKAKLMYWAVYQFGPRWKPVHETRMMPDGTPRTITKWVPDTPPTPSQETVENAVRYFDDHDPALSDIPTLELPEF